MSLFIIIKIQIMNFFNNFKYMDFSFSIEDCRGEYVIIINGDLNYDIAKNIDFGIPYIYKIFTNEEKPLTKNNISFGCMLYTLPYIDALSIAKSLSNNNCDFELNRELKYNLICRLRRFRKYRHIRRIRRNIFANPYLELAIKLDAINCSGGNDVFSLVEKLEETIYESDLVKKIIAEKELMHSGNKDININMSLAYTKL